MRGLPPRGTCAHVRLPLLPLLLVGVLRESTKLLPMTGNLAGWLQASAYRLLPLLLLLLPPLLLLIAWCERQPSCCP